MTEKPIEPGDIPSIITNPRIKSILPLPVHADESRRGKEDPKERPKWMPRRRHQHMMYKQAQCIIPAARIEKPSIRSLGCGIDLIGDRLWAGGSLIWLKPAVSVNASLSA